MAVSWRHVKSATTTTMEGSATGDQGWARRVSLLFYMAGFLLQPQWWHQIKPQAKRTCSLIMNDACVANDE